MEDEMTDFLLKNGRFFQKDYFRELLERAVTTFFDYIILEGYGSVSPKKTEEKPIRPLNNSRAQRKRRRP